MDGLALGFDHLVRGGRAIGGMNMDVVLAVGPIDADESAGIICGTWPRLCETPVVPWRQFGS